MPALRHALQDRAVSGRGAVIDFVGGDEANRRVLPHIARKLPVPSSFMLNVHAAQDSAQGAFLGRAMSVPAAVATDTTQC